MLENVKYFTGSLIVTIVGLILALVIGGPSALLIVAVLGVSFSFDNDVVNATVLKDMDAVRGRRFLTWRTLIAVFGMYILFPVLIVSVLVGVSPWGALDIAINPPAQYTVVMTQAHLSLMALGGVFLMMVGCGFFFDAGKDHSIPVIEMPLAKLEKFKFAAESLTLVLIAVVSLVMLPEADKKSFAVSGIAGVATFWIIQQLSAFMERREKARAATHAARSGAAMFIYLEFLDASFSFNGAFYAIVALASLMFLKTFFNMPEAVIGYIGTGFIGVAFIHSQILKAQESKSYV